MQVVIDGVEYVPFVHKEDGEWLDVRFYDYISLDREVTVREFFKEMLQKLWYDPEGFSGKRPFGNSCWYYPVIYALVEAGGIAGSIIRDEEGYVEDSKFDATEADKFVQGLIAQMCLDGA